MLYQHTKQLEQGRFILTQGLRECIHHDNAWRWKCEIAGHIVSAVRKESTTEAVLSSLHYLFIGSRATAHQMMLLTFGVDLPSPVQPLGKHLSRHA